MSRRHFEALADALASVRPSDTHSEAFAQWNHDVTKVANVCAESNGAFKRDKFYSACQERRSYV